MSEKSMGSQKKKAVNNQRPAHGAKRRALFDKTLVLMLLIMVTGYFFIHDLYGGTLLEHNAWDSYTLQAYGWQSGRLSVDAQHANYLELAVYNGEYFVSFPPFPSVVMFPLTLIFGMDTPNNLVVMVYALIIAAAAYKIFRLCKMKDTHAALLALGFIWGSSTFWMSTIGGVWFQAQLLALALGLLTVYCALTNRRVLAYLFTAFAVGCRPFYILLFPIIFVFFYMNDREDGEGGFFKTALKQWKCLIAPVLIGCAYLWYNYIRFDNPLEFGHNYLPEFTESEKGQFSLSYIWPNLLQQFDPVELKFADGKLRMEYSIFNGFMFFVANPLFILLFVSAAKNIIKRRTNAVSATLMAGMLLELLLLCMHKTMGGWQFGARYICDLLPMLAMYLACSRLKEEALQPSGTPQTLKHYEIYIIVFGILLNAYGCMAMNFYHG